MLDKRQFHCGLIKRVRIANTRPNQLKEKEYLGFTTLTMPNHDEINQTFKSDPGYFERHKGLL